MRAKSLVESSARSTSGGRVRHQRSRAIRPRGYKRPSILGRRRFLHATVALGTAAVFGLHRRCPSAAAEQPPAENQPTPGWLSPQVRLRTITRPPGFHWFGYYDKFQVDASGRYVLGMAVDFEHRTPQPDDEIRIGMVDLQDGDRWIELGRSRAWCWQQGCMLQWVPGSRSQIIWNDRQDDRLVCHLMDVQTRQMRTVPHPIYTLTPDGRMAVSPDFRRIQAMRPGYGYTGLPDPWADELAPRHSGIFHYFNHLLVSPDGRRFAFLHRWRGPAQKGFGTRMLTAALDGSDLRVIDPSGHTSHYIWRDPEHILAWTHHPSHGKAFYLFEDRAGAK